MINKRYFFVLILIIVAVGAISSVSAEDINSADGVIAQNIATDDIETIDGGLSAQLADEDTLNVDENTKELKDSQENAKIIPDNLLVSSKSSTVTVKLTDLENNPIANKTIKLRLLNELGEADITYSQKTDENGIAYYNSANFMYKEGTAYKTLTSGTWNIKLESGDSDVIAKTVNEKLYVGADATLSITNLTDYYGSKNIVTISLVNSQNGKGIKGAILRAYIPYTTEEYYYVSTDENGRSTISVDKLLPGTYEVFVTPNETDYIKSNMAYGKVIIKQLPITLKASKLTTTYNSGKNFQIKVFDNKNNPVKNLKLKLKVYTGSNFVTKYVTTNDNGIANYKTSGLSKGTHKIVIMSTDSAYSAKSISSSIVINAKKLYIAGESNKYKECGQLILGAYDKSTKKLISGVKLQIKIFTGKKSKTFNLVTKYSKDIGDVGVLLETNAFSVGKHKVTVKIISPTGYKGSDSGELIIPKSSKNYSKFTYVITNGKGKYV